MRPSPPLRAVSPQNPSAGAKDAHILVVDDDRRIRALLTRYLMREGYFVSAAADAREASALLVDFAFDLIVLDCMMPGESGTQFAARLREGPEPLRSAPILMLTALHETRNRVEGLEAGVDDYLAKPFDPRELSLRIASILRRARRPESVDPLVRFGPFAYDPARAELTTQAGEAVRLTTRERDMLQILVEHAGAIVSRQTLASRESEPKAAERSVDVEIARLRRKIELDPGAPRYLQTVRGQGYRLVVDAPRARKMQS
ncbi:response regulator [Methylocystis sp. Sn-Cys]|uniref:response regulator n=1 Tax=Methylocystis sp. Sn-Cys TaxID=1701263 RepID=UPI0019207F9D|nr:response regulator transcription factor [Methylocystis sp. Sn-Cys]MBL1256286.1 response regulator transcription factor [Methylocystis sp. Sn-Cys]